MALGIYDYFARACRRDTEVSGVSGSAATDAEGNTATFWVTVRRGVIRSVRYKCTTCVTLVAFCEHLSEIAQDQAASEAVRFPSEQLLAAHTEVPPERRSRAALAVSALQSAIRKATEEPSNEGSLHLLDTRAHGFL